MKYQAVIFDLDDTLLDSVAARVDSLQRAFDAAGVLHPTGAEFFKTMRGIELREGLSQLPGTKAMASDLFNAYRRIYWTKKKGLIRLYRGVKPMLKRLNEQGIKLAIVTQKWRSFEIEGHPAGITKELEEVGILPLFSVIIGFEDVSQPKPDPQGINKILNSLGVPPEDALMVGDSKADIEAGLAAGCRSCYAIWGTPVEYRLKDMRANFILKSPAALDKLVLPE